MLLELLESLDTDLLNINSPYSFGNIQVPRVTEVLSAMLHEEYLMDWANRVGLYQHKSHVYYRDRAATIGTYVHNAIERYVSIGEDLDISSVPSEYRNKVNNAFSGFKLWWNNITNNHKHKVIFQEYTLVCQYYGGTLDLLLEVDGKIYLIDFKISNYPSYKYFLQLSAYRYMLRMIEDIDVDGCFILMLDKDKPSFKEMFLDCHNQDQLIFINQCENTFHSIVYSYYNRMITETMYNKLYG